MRSVRFWAIQVLILLVAALHTVVLGLLDGRDIDGIPAPLTSSLVLIPVLYSAVRFGASAALVTASWATLLFSVHWWAIVEQPVAPDHLWIELVSMVVLGASGVVVGRRVDAERDAVRRAERALSEVAVARERFRDLFEHQPSPVVVTDLDGVVVEANDAAHQLLGAGAVGHSLSTMTGLDGPALVALDSPVALAGSDGRVRHYVASTHSFGDADAAVTQIVFADVSREHSGRELQRALTGRVVQVQEQERLHLARELHDDALQQLTHLARMLDELCHDPTLSPALARTVCGSMVVANLTASSLRQVIQGLRPPVLDDLGLVPALRQLTENAARNADASLRFTVVGPVARPSADVELAAFRIVQEALTNALKHARARRIDVDVAFGTEITVQVRDDGRGFSTSSRPGAGLGLVGIRERAAGVGGDLRVESQEGHGTTVRLALPLVGHADDDPA
ncbi:MAG: hypothetical protein B7X41_01395 [Microbacterium sp. 14-71-5]|nr:MAG: hypothetical protein B7X41_01395 [Microbacterium sp. 14-71-5]